jgi:D-threo-aldose 1-dehydrogenase
VPDYSRDAVLCSLEASLERLALDRVDIALIHDPDDHMGAALEHAYPALAELRAQGVVRAIGAGMDQAPALTRFVRETDVDCVLVAGRYTLLDHSAGEELLPECRARGVAAIAGGVFNSGVLADPWGRATYDYRTAPEPVVTRARRIAEICAGHGVPVAAAAMAFPLRHPARSRVLRRASRPPSSARRRGRSTGSANRLPRRGRSHRRRCGDERDACAGGDHRRRAGGGGKRAARAADAAPRMD